MNMDGDAMDDVWFVFLFLFLKPDGILIHKWGRGY